MRGLLRANISSCVPILWLLMTKTFRMIPRIFQFFCLLAYALCTGCGNGNQIQEPQHFLSELILEDMHYLDPESKVPYTGWVIQRYPGDMGILSKSHIADGKLDGVSYGYHTNGVLKLEEHFIKGISDGLRVRYNMEGQKTMEENIAEGKLHGLVLKYHPDGRLAESLPYFNGNVHGEASAYYDDGSTRSRATFEHGIMKSQQFWNVGERVDP